MAEASQFIKHSGIGIAGNAVSAMLALLYVAILGHRISAAEYALVASALSLGYIASLIVTPLESSVSHAAAICHGQGARHELRAVAVRALTRSIRPILLAVILWLPLSILLKAWLHFPTLTPLMWLGAFFALSFPAAILRGIFRGDRRFFAYSFSQVVESGVRLMTGVIAVAWGLGASGAILGYALGMTVVVLFGFWQLRDLTTAAAVPLDAVPLDNAYQKTSSALLLFYFYLPFVANADVLVAKHYLDPREAGHYGAAATLSRMIYLGAAPIYQVLFSYVAAQNTRGESSRNLAFWVGTGTAFLLLMGLIIPLLFGPGILTMIFGTDYAVAAPILRIVWLSTSLLVLETVAGFFLIGKGRLKGIAVSLLPCLAMTVLLSLFHRSAVQIARCGLAAVLGGGAMLAWTVYSSGTTSRTKSRAAS